MINSSVFYQSAWDGCGVHVLHRLNGTRARGTNTDRRWTMEQIGCKKNVVSRLNQAELGLEGRCYVPVVVSIATKG